VYRRIVHSFTRFFEEADRTRHIDRTNEETNKRLFPVRHHPQKPCSLYCILQHFLVLEADAGVVALPDVTKVIKERFDGWVVLVVYVLCILVTEGALLMARICPALLLLASHK